MSLFSVQNFFRFHNIPIILSAFYLIATYVIKSDNKICIKIGILPTKIWNVPGELGQNNTQFSRVF